jgi:glycosyltransferase involved in cell wall biosynthesis
MNEHVHAVVAAPGLSPASGASTQSIVFLGTAHDNGGSSILAGNLAAAMRAQGHHVEEWYLFGSSADPRDVRVFHRGRRSRSPWLLIRLFAQVVRALRAARPDAVIGLQPLSNLIAGVAGRIAGVPMRVATLHNPAGQFNRVLMALDRLFGSLGLYNSVVACSQSVADTFRGNGTRYRERLSVVRNGHAAPVMIARSDARQRLGLPPDGIVLGQIGRLSAQKNQSFSLDLIRDLPDAHLLMVGIGPDKAALKAKIEVLRLGSRVHVLPAIDHARIGEFYSAVDLVLFPSQFEGLSLAGIEAIHAGVPLLCSDIPSFREMFEQSDLLSSILLLPLDRRAWVTRIREVLDSPALRDQVAAELGALSPTYDFDRMAADYLRLIERR